MDAFDPPARNAALPRYLRVVTAVLQAPVAAFLLAAFLLIAPARAESGLAADTHIAAALAVERAVAPGETAPIAIVMRPAPGWHGYWLNPGDAGFGIRLDWALPAGARVGRPAFPVPETLVIAGLMNHVYNHDHALLVPFTVPASARPGSRLAVAVNASWLACTDQICVPERARLETTVAVAAPGAANPRDPRFDEWMKQLPAPLGTVARFALAGDRLRLAIPLPADVPLADPHLFVATERAVQYAAEQQFARDGDMLLVSLRRAPQAAPLTELWGVLRLDAAGNGLSFSAVPGPVPAGGTPLGGRGPSGAGALALLVLAAFAGGLLLNVMPCVFPILSLKAVSLARAGESARAARREGLAYAAGVVLACMGLGAAMLGLRAAGNEVGWAFQLQEPLVVAALLLLAIAITANFAGLFEFAVPGFAQASPAARGTAGAFLTGLLAAFVATPCTGPFMAAAMGAALLLPPTDALALFAALGLGIAFPFLLLAFVPALRRRLPPPGRWMGRFRMMMAVPMGLTALALGWLASRLGGWAFAATAAALALVLLLALAWAGRRQRTGRAVPGGAVAGFAAALALGFVTLAQLRAAPAAADASLPGTRPWSETALAAARASGKPVFVWFTADWCLTCKVNERVAIETAATRAAFAGAGVIPLRGDWTRRDPAITRFLGQHGAAGVPLYLWYAPGKDAQVLDQLLAPSTLPGLAATPPSPR